MDSRIARLLNQKRIEAKMESELIPNLRKPSYFNILTLLFYKVV
jgi:hypothetical protein